MTSPVIVHDERHQFGAHVIVSIDLGAPREDCTALVATTTAGRPIWPQVIDDWWGALLSEARRAGRRADRAEHRSRRLVALQQRRRHGRPRGRG